jgi:hypothetical protein
MITFYRINSITNKGIIRYDTPYQREVSKYGAVLGHVAELPATNPHSKSRTAFRNTKREINNTLTLDLYV